MTESRWLTGDSSLVLHRRHNVRHDLVGESDQVDGCEDIDVCVCQRMRQQIAHLAKVSSRLHLVIAAPPAIVEQAQNIQEGLNDLGELYRIRNEISGQIDYYPAQGNSQG